MNNLLVISFDSFSKEGTNGKTLWSLLKASSFNNNVSQIFIKPGIPNIEGKCRFLYINEKNITKPFLSRKRMGVEIQNSLSKSNDMNSNGTKTKKCAFTMIIRNFLWRLAYLKFKFIFKWIDQQKPDHLIVQDSDLPFFCFFARKIAKRYNCGITFFTTENYSLKKNDYMNGKFNRNLFYSLFRKSLYREHKKLLQITKNEIFLTKSLQTEYSEHYVLNNPIVVYPSSSFQPLHKKAKEDKIIFSYCGNLKVGRFETLILFLKSLNTHLNFKLILASNLSSEEIKAISLYKNVDYRGFVSFENVLDIYKNSDVLVHFESFEEKLAEDCKHAFSGKIVDCISSLKPFLYFGPRSNATSDFLSEYNCGFQANSESDLVSFLNKVDSNSINLFENENNAIYVSNKLFNEENNSQTVCKQIFDGNYVK